MATEKVSDELVSKRAWCRFGIRAIFLATFVGAIGAFVAKDIDFSIFINRSHQIPVLPTERSDNASQVLSKTDIIPPDIEIAIKSSILKRISEEDEIEGNKVDTGH